MPIETMVVGSFPKSNSLLEEAIGEVVDLQLHYGIDLITDGELRCNMIQYFEQIPGLERLGDGLRIVGQVEPIEQDEIDEFYKIKDYRAVRSILESMGKGSVKVKVGITGPMTLGTICASTDADSTLQHYDLEEEEALYSDFSHALLPVVQRALDIGAYVQIDEPLLSTGQVSLESAGKVLKDFASRLPSFSIEEEKVMCHVCGSIESVAGLYDVLLGLGIPILSLGFSGERERENFDVISRTSFEGHGKKLAAGFISNVNVEDESVAMERYRRIEGIVGRENIKYVSPDCGFRLTSPERVRSILERMKAVADKIV
jgi:methionine synthase II (cobalamin-independent)